MLREVVEIEWFDQWWPDDDGEKEVTLRDEYQPEEDRRLAGRLREDWPCDAEDFLIEGGD